MWKVRATKKDSDEVVVGQHLQINLQYWTAPRHYLVPSPADAHFSVGGIRLSSPLFEIDPTTAAIATGKFDKNGTEIFGSKGEFQGGDRVNWTLDELYDAGEKIRTYKGTGSVKWIPEHVCWGIVERTGGGYQGNGFWEAAEFEIIEETE